MDAVQLQNDLGKVDINYIYNILTEDFHKKLFNAILANLMDVNNALRLNNFAYSAREFIRIYLDSFIEVDKVKEAGWFDEKVHMYNGKLTRKTKMHYLIHKYVHPQYIIDELDIDIYDIIKNLVSDIDVLNKYTHISDTFLQEDTNNEIAIKLLKSLYNFLKTIHDINSEIIKLIESEIYEIASEALSIDYLEELGEISTHYFIEEVDVEEVKLSEFSPSEITCKVSGSLGCILQYGSDRDVENDIGMQMSESYPFEIDLFIQIPDIKGYSNDYELNIIRFANPRVDTSNFFE